MSHDRGRRQVGSDEDDKEPVVRPRGRRVLPSHTVDRGDVTALTFFIDGQGSAITTGFKGVVDAPFDGELIAGYLYLDQSGSIVVDVWKDTFANYPPTNADTITAGAELTITTDTDVQDLALVDWERRFFTGDVFGFNVDSITTATWCYVSLWARRFG
jgi:hypothetical protein